MQSQLEFSFSDLKCKLVINVTDGKILGNIIDVVFLPQAGKILGFIVPGAKKSFFKSAENIFIPYNCVCKVGIDVILVELFVDSKPSCPPNCCPTNKFNNMINILENNENLSKNDENCQNEEYKIEVIDPSVYPK